MAVKWTVESQQVPSQFGARKVETNILNILNVGAQRLQQAPSFASY